MKVLTIIGARPQFIKAAPVSRELRRRASEILVHSGQHYDAAMSDVFFEELEIPRPDYHLGIGSKSHGEQTGEMLTKVERVLMEEKPDWVMVYGDTNTTLAGALAAAKLDIPVAHVEAGLRSFNRKMPEEINRVLTDHVSRLLFCPTDTAVSHLKREGIATGVYQVGDVMVDALQHNRRLAQERSRILDQLGLSAKGYILVTWHRAENTDDPVRLAAIAAALNALEQPTVLPLHPRTRQRLDQAGLKLNNPHLHLLTPVGYLDMLQLEANASLILTDSGGVQKEAFLLQVPCVTMRDETEWTETVEQGANRLVGANSQSILQAVDGVDVDFNGVQLVFGDGRASKRIAETLAH